MSGPRYTWERVATIFARALQAGAKRPSLGRVEWDISGRCQAPKTLVLSAAPSEGLRDTRRSRRGRYVHLVPGLTRCTLTVELTTRCRRCVWCLRRRANKWRLSARSELDQAAGRSWFGTLTFRPEDRYRVLCTADRAASRRGLAWAAMEPADRFRYLANAAGALVTKWLKRVRKETGVPFRYLLVVEAHKSGDPHFHVLLHEQRAEEPLRKEVLQRQWSHGFSKWNLVKDRATAGYVTKYLSKDMMARVRASVRYGKTRPIAIVEKRVDPDPLMPLSLVAPLDGALLGDAEGLVYGGGVPGDGVPEGSEVEQRGLLTGHRRRPGLSYGRDPPPFGPG